MSIACGSYRILAPSSHTAISTACVQKPSSVSYVKGGKPVLSACKHLLCHLSISLLLSVDITRSLFLCFSVSYLPAFVGIARYLFLCLLLSLCMSLCLPVSISLYLLVGISRVSLYVSLCLCAVSVTFCLSSCPCPRASPCCSP